MRGEGTTTLQIKTAPIGSLFVWVNEDIRYPRRLAEKLGRGGDIMIVSPSWVVDQKWRGLELGGLIVDHAIVMTDELHHALQLARTRVRVWHRSSTRPKRKAGVTRPKCLY